MHQVLFSFLLLVFFLLFCTAECRRSHQSPAYSKKTLSNASYLYAYVHRPHRPQPLTSGLPSTLLNHHRQGIDDAGRGEFSQHLRRGNLHGDFFYELVDSKWSGVYKAAFTSCETWLWCIWFPSTGWPTSLDWCIKDRLRQRSRVVEKTKIESKEIGWRAGRFSFNGRKDSGVATTHWRARARACVCARARFSLSLSSAPCLLVCICHSVSLGVSVCSAIVVHSSRGKEFD